jgi:hypothetical protein
MGYEGTPSIGYSPNKSYDFITAADVAVVDVGGYYASDDVEGALQEVGAFMVAEDIWDRDVPTTTVTLHNAGDTVNYLDGEVVEFGTTDSVTMEYDTATSTLLFLGEQTAFQRDITTGIGYEVTNSIVMNLSPIANNDKSHYGGTDTIQLLTDIDLTAGPLFPAMCSRQQNCYTYGTGTVSEGLGNEIGIGNVGTGFMTKAVGYSIGPYVDTVDGVTDLSAFRAGNNWHAASGSITNSYMFEIDSDYITSATGVNVLRLGSTDAFIPLSEAETGITFDSTDVVLATTTTGDVILDPVDDIYLNKDSIIPQDGVASVVNRGVPSHYIELQAEGWDTPGAVGYDTSARIVNYQPVGSSEEVGNISYLFGDRATETLRFVTTVDAHTFVPDLFTGVQDDFEFSAAGTATGDGCNITFAGGGSFGGNGDGGDLIFVGGFPNGAGVYGQVFIGNGAAGVDFSLTFDGETNDGVITWMEDEDYFQFDDDIFMYDGSQIFFRSDQQWIYSSGAGRLNLVAVNLDLYSNNITFGRNLDADVVLNFSGATNDGTITWMEDEAGWDFDSNIGIGVVPSHPLHIVPGTTDTKSLYIDGATNDFVTASTDCANLELTRDIAINADTPTDYFGVKNTLNIKHTDAVVTALNETYNFGVFNKINDDGTYEYDSIWFGRTYDVGTYNFIDNDAVYDSSSTGQIWSQVLGEHIEINYNAEFTESGGVAGPASVDIDGMRIEIDSDPTLTSGTMTVQNNGIWIDVRGTTVGSSSVARGIMIYKSEGCDSNWGIYDVSGADWLLGTDSQKLKFGSYNPSGDAYIEFDGDSLNIVGNQVTATDNVEITANATVTNSGRIKTTTRITNADSPYTILATDDVIFCDTDGGAITANLPVGVNGTTYRIINCGSSGNDVTVTPNGAELLTGVNASRTLSDSSVIILTFETTEGWW